MDYSQFLYMRPEITLLAVMLFLFLYDLFAGKKARMYFHVLACVLLAVHTVLNLMPPVSASAFGGMYLCAPTVGFVKTLLSAGTLAVVMQAASWLRRSDTEYKRGEFYVLTLSTLLGMYFMMSAGHFLMFALGLELASVPLACLVAFDKYRRHAAEAGAKYILSAMFSSGLMLYGISLIYGTTGTLYFDGVVAGLTGTPLQVLALVFFFAGLGFKISLVPFHLWTADVYEGAPVQVTAYLSAVSKFAAVYTLMVICLKVFVQMLPLWQDMLYWVIIATITVANLFAVRQQNLKRLFAFSSISQAGYLMLGVIGGSADGVPSLVFYALAYMAANLVIFGIISVIEQHTEGKVSLADYNGLYRTNPKLTLLMTLALFSLAGIPPFAGFFSKFFIFMTAFQSGFRLLVFVALINTVISLYYYLLVIKAMYICPNEQPVAPFRSDLYTRLSLLLCTAGVLAPGIIGSLYEWINGLGI
ncbi:MAG: NADH-quinone oxidoreductase subunit N [Tannerella sp.]|jgi:NADH-quinone oxidoreductase subunit N|nr:NADH-quinone oxidoreductase subunit N [Tannerella sp.]